MRVFIDHIIHRLTTPVSILCLLITITSSAQDVQNETNLFIANGLTVQTNGNLLNNGLILNRGRIELKGNWLNNSIYQGPGAIALTGVDQSLSNNNQAIGHLIGEGGGIKTIKGSILVTDQIDFSNGIFLIRNTDSLTLEEGCEVNNPSLLSYVDGALSTRGTGYRLYPVGKNGAYHPVELTEITGIDPVVAVEVMENLPVVQTSAAADIYDDIYWTRKTVSGTFQNSPITLSYDVNSDVSQRRLVIAEGRSTTEEFTIINNVTFIPSNTADIVGSKVPVTGDLFALGEVPVEPPREQYLSTTLSPYAENPINRVVRVFGDNPNPSIFSFQVFNRWGILIYENQSYSSMNTDGWDGRQQGTMLNSGVYPYNLKMVDISGNTISRTGFITIIN